MLLCYGAKNKVIMFDKAVPSHRSWGIKKSIIMYSTRFMTAGNVYSAFIHKCIIININISGIFCKGAMTSIWIA